MYKYIYKQNIFIKNTKINIYVITKIINLYDILQFKLYCIVNKHIKNDIIYHTNYVCVLYIYIYNVILCC